MCNNGYVVTIGADGAVMLTTLQGVLADHNALLLRVGVTYQFTVKDIDGM